MPRPTPTQLKWPPQGDEAKLGLICIESEIDLPGSCASVHGYITTPARWHEWHPATRSVEPLPDRPLVTGETMTEHISAGGHRFSTTWEVLACDSPRLWVIATYTPKGIARIVYRLDSITLPNGQPGTRFHRTLVCRSLQWPWYWLDSLVMRPVLTKQSAQALRNLQQVLTQRAALDDIHGQNNKSADSAAA
jgi:hypothetical protein